MDELRETSAEGDHADATPSSPTAAAATAPPFIEGRTSNGGPKPMPMQKRQLIGMQ